ncbi:Nif3-like dinuclear metal center hexameric protein [Peptoniphilus sp. MSJ-1]|uniref:Nif3-like dinuclear metal center hexameric protein n=1 Tax=Peptoniphilus ovalis TaxID=2841503 RepID=A0ABS6FIG1_9FIRM|nr:Nif3-like dinuclear metal center hexameric protein [Peptoniphilus ovalis]MBU5669965.1 Nif3-like dinuclear metal center hexameric protein [Peptoniphilus ovalis]
MKYQIKEIKEFMTNWAKDEYQLSWDNSGSQIEFNEKTDSVVVGMDLTDELVDLAIKNGSKLIVTHHPMFFSGVKNIIENTYSGDNIIKLIENRISVFSYHTSMDIADDGVNDSLFEKLMLKNKEVLIYEEEKPMGLVGELKISHDLKGLLDGLRDILDLENIRVYGKEREINKVALMGGAGADFLREAIKIGADAYITGDVKYHDGQSAYENEIILVDIGHFHSEKFIIPKIEKNLKDKFEDLEVHTLMKSSYELDF